jgi:hypothetical protein
MSHHFKVGDWVRVNAPHAEAYHNKVYQVVDTAGSSIYVYVSEQLPSLHGYADQFLPYGTSTIQERVINKIKYLDTKKYKCKSTSVFTKGKQNEYAF